MLLKLPFWRYPAVILFSVLIHGILLLMLIKQTQQVKMPTDIRWFEFTELELPKPITGTVPELHIIPKKQALDNPKILHQSLKASSPKNDTLRSNIPEPVNFPTPLLERKEKPVEQKISSETEIVETIQTQAIWESNNNEPTQTEMHTETPHLSIDKTDKGPKLDSFPEKVPGHSISFDEVLKDTRLFQNQTFWKGGKAQHTVSISLGALLTGIKMISINNDSAEAETNLRLDSGEAQRYREDLNTFFSKRWEVPLHLADSELTVVTRIRIDKDGQIQKSEIEVPSGNSELDHSVEKLLKSLQSLPSLPYSYLGHSYEFGIRFTPRDFQF